MRIKVPSLRFRFIPSTIEVDIGICPTNLCKLVAAANNAPLGPPRIFYSTDCGLNWLPMTHLDPFPEDHRYSHQSVGWTSDQRVWLITMATPVNPGGIFLRCYSSDDNGVTWKQDPEFVVEETTIQSPRMWVDHISGVNLGYLDTIYVIYGSGQSVFVKSRNPKTGKWTPKIPLDSQSTGDVSGCDIKNDNSGTVTVTAFWHDTGSGKLLASSSSSNDPQNGPVFGPTSTIANATATPGISIPSCAINKAAISISSVGWATYVYVVWADLTEDGTKTRIWFSKATNSYGIIGAWSDKKMINDGQSLNDQFHPRFVMDLYTNSLVVVYYDTVDDPTRHQTGVWMQTSEDYGENWSSPLRLSTATPPNQTDETAVGANQFQYGDYLGLTGAAPPGVLFAAWTDRRSGLAEQIWAARIRIPPISEPCSSDPILNGATITFTTTTDDKDPDTKVDIRLDGAYYWEVAATASGDYGRFADHSPHSVSLEISKFLVTRSRLQKGRVFIKITPQGNDTWRFTFNLDLTFTNGETMHLENPPEITLNQEVETSYILVPINSMIQI